ncbi:uncharacterized protein SPSK_04573 [Sporothrix schenckii 1099-18]|uniref:Uncharacterized protein n=1 Tax=Sporothrix schenckii 1099-18 TaxID=1397361 RepID=A0A0F2M2C1_SPOSC|nr:uncharacterized protein SPSK_04573 [Sporothrix schenckii 1099-18]KJR83858.1 hypothetical protein SPSK_04573 [Sporothrix schenckii 1099-18]
MPPEICLDWLLWLAARRMSSRSPPNGSLEPARRDGVPWAANGLAGLAGRQGRDSLHTQTLPSTGPKRAHVNAGPVQDEPWLTMNELRRTTTLMPVQPGSGCLAVQHLAQRHAHWTAQESCLDALRRVVWGVDRGKGGFWSLV